jgi:hypothetical protein
VRCNRRRSCHSLILLLGVVLSPGSEPQATRSRAWASKTGNMDHDAKLRAFLTNLSPLQRMQYFRLILQRGRDAPFPLSSDLQERKHTAVTGGKAITAKPSEVSRDDICGHRSFRSLDFRGQRATTSQSAPPAANNRCGLAPRGSRATARRRASPSTQSAPTRQRARTRYKNAPLEAPLHNFDRILKDRIKRRRRMAKINIQNVYGSSHQFRMHSGRGASRSTRSPDRPTMQARDGVPVQQAAARCSVRCTDANVGTQSPRRICNIRRHQKQQNVSKRRDRCALAPSSTFQCYAEVLDAAQQHFRASLRTERATTAHRQALHHTEPSHAESVALSRGSKGIAAEPSLCLLKTMLAQSQKLAQVLDEVRANATLKLAQTQGRHVRRLEREGKGR